MPQLNLKEERLKGNEYFKQQNFVMALELYKKLIEEGEVQLQGLEDFEKQDDLKRELSLLYFNISVTFYRLNYLNKALINIEKAIELDKNEKFLAKKAFYKLKDGNYKEAQIIFNNLENKKALNELPLMFNDLRHETIEKEFAFLDWGDFQPFDFEFDEENIKFNIDFIEKVSKEFKEKKILPAKMVYCILRELYAVYSNQDNVIFLDCDEEVIIFGDTHGQYFNTLSIINKIKLSTVGLVIFNGDLVDRGFNSFENFIFVALLKIVFPNKIFINRGNHEFYELNVTMGFYLELCYKYKENAMKVFPAFSHVFSVLPIATIINRNTFIVHGGLPGEEISITDILKLNRKITNSTTNTILNGLLWSDPSEIDGCSPSRRGVGVYFGENILNRFLEKNNLSLFIRSHEFVEKGYKLNHNNKTITIFSSPNYCNAISKGAYIKLNKNFDGKFENLEIIDYDVYSEEEVFLYS